VGAEAGTGRSGHREEPGEGNRRGGGMSSGLSQLPEIARGVRKCHRKIARDRTEIWIIICKTSKGTAGTKLGPQAIKKAEKCSKGGLFDWGKQAKNGGNAIEELEIYKEILNPKQVHLLKSLKAWSKDKYSRGLRGREEA